MTIIIYLKFQEESGMRRILTITMADGMVTACYGQMTDCCLSPTIIMKHFWKLSKGGYGQWNKKRLLH